MSIKTRFAPSPTGMMHIGNARTALITWLFARSVGGKFLLRLDDTDTERSKPEYETAIKESLEWLGLDWDETFNQKDRTALYDEKIEQLKQSGDLYPCYETADELALKRKSQLSRGKPPIYDREGLSLTNEQKAAFEADGRSPHWRFKMKHEPIIWQDLIRGEVNFKGEDISDPVVIRENGNPLYHLCSIIDDIDSDITHVTRGEDHVANTAAHIQMFEALGAKPPQFAHLSLISAADGSKLSKRFGSLSIFDVRDEDGLEAMTVTSLLARIGTSAPIEAFSSIKPLIDSFDFSRFSRSTPKFDGEELERLNSKILHEMSFIEAQPRLASLGLDNIDEAFWLAVRPNLTTLRDVKEWARVANGPVEPVIEDPDFIAEALSLLPSTPWDENTWGEWTKAVKEKTGRKGKQLFMPLRMALTGMQHGPELNVILLLIGSERVTSRLSVQKAA